jgi:hypothetical protein
MRYFTTAIAITALGALLAAAADPQQGPSVADQLKELSGIFKQNLQSIETGFLDTVDKCRDAYAVSLKGAEDAATRSGDLDGVLKIQQEQKRFSDDRAVDDEIAPDTHPLIKEAVQAYLKSLETANRNRNIQAAALAGKYMDRLESLKRKLTTQKNITEALAVDEEIKRVKIDPSVGEALAAQPAAPAQAQNTACTACEGTGVIKQPCPDCSSSGACGYCEGTGVRAGLGGKGISCFVCTGSKKCKKCAGTGQLTQKCAQCSGKGRLR